MYCETNYKTKKALKAAVGNEERVFQPGPFGDGFKTDGTFTVEGPHYPQPHRWYAHVTLRDGKIVSVK